MAGRALADHAQSPRIQQGWRGVGLATAGLAAAAIAAVGVNRGALPLLILLGLLGLASAAYLAWNVDPAWTLSGSIALSVFGGYWGQLGPLGYLPVTPDRLHAGGGCRCAPSACSGRA